LRLSQLKCCGHHESGRSTCFPDNPIDLDPLERKLGWLREFDRELRAWTELLEVIDATED